MEILTVATLVIVVIVAIVVAVVAIGAGYIHKTIKKHALSVFFYLLYKKNENKLNSHFLKLNSKINIKRNIIL